MRNKEETWEVVSRTVPWSRQQAPCTKLSSARGLWRPPASCLQGVSGAGDITVSCCFEKALRTVTQSQLLIFFFLFLIHMANTKLRPLEGGGTLVSGENEKCREW